MLKNIMAVGLFALSTASFAEVKSEVKNLSNVKFDGSQLDLSYQTGGGCQTHEAKVEVVLTPSKNGVSSQYTAAVSVYDVSPQFDACEAIIGVEASVNLKDIIKLAASAQGLTPSEIRSVSVELPYLRLDR